MCQVATAFKGQQRVSQATEDHTQSTSWSNSRKLDAAATHQLAIGPDWRAEQCELYFAS